MAKLTKKQEARLETVAYHLERALGFLARDSVAVARREWSTFKPLPTEFVRAGGKLTDEEVELMGIPRPAKGANYTLSERCKATGDLAGLEMGLASLRRFIESNKQD